MDHDFWSLLLCSNLPFVYDYKKIIQWRGCCSRARNLNYSVTIHHQGGTLPSCPGQLAPLPLWSLLSGSPCSGIWSGLALFDHFFPFLDILSPFPGQKGLFLSMTVPATFVLMFIIVCLILAFSFAHWLAYHNTVDKGKLFQERFEQFWTTTITQK